MSYPKLAVEYFDIEGRGEIPRAICWINDIPFEDIRHDYNSFLAKKAECPLGQLPVLHVDDVVIPQSQAINRYLGKLTKLYPDDALEALNVDVITETAEEVVSSIGGTMRIPAEQREEARKKLVAEKFPVLFGFFEKKIKESQEQGSPFIANGKFSIADLLLLCSVYGWINMNILDHIPASTMDAYPVFLKYIEDLKQTEPIKKYYEVKAEKTGKK